MLRQSCLPVLEDVLGHGMMGKRQSILASAMKVGITDLRAETGRVINIRKRDLTEQMMELKGLQGKNASVIKHMRARISQEQAEFDLGGAKIHAVRSVHLRLLREVFELLGPKRLKAEVLYDKRALPQPIKLYRPEHFEFRGDNTATCPAGRTLASMTTGQCAKLCVKRPNACSDASSAQCRSSKSMTAGATDDADAIIAIMIRSVSFLASRGLSVISPKRCAKGTDIKAAM